MYVDALIRELRARADRYTEYEVISIFFGGGTPSILSDKDIDRIMDTLKTEYNICYDCEVSMEVNPGTVTGHTFEALKNTGINRISFGLQSTLDSELKTLGRIHDFREFLGSYRLAADAGFTSINVDLMSGIPGQTIESLALSLKTVVGLEPKPTHISTYGLILEEGTPFYEIYGEGDSRLPSEETERDMYEVTHDILSKAGYHRYEISNYALDGFECLHNSVYWRRGNYLGIGLGASSMVENCRWKNTSSMDEYLGMDSVPEEEYTVLSPKEQMEEYMFLGLRMTEGISADDFENEFKVPFLQQYCEVIAKYKAMGMMEETPNHRVMLTKTGINVSNVILSDFLFENDT